MKLGLDVYWGNECTGRLEIDGLTVLKNVCYLGKDSRNPLHPFPKYPFCNKMTSGYMIVSYLRDRVYQPERADINKILGYFGLKEYNWIELLKKTHGASMDDLLWFKIDGNGDENLTFPDVHDGVSCR